MKTKALTFLLLITFCLNSKQTDAAIAHDTVFYNCVGNANLTTNGINDNYSWFMPMQGGQFIRLNITNYNIADGAILNVYSGTNVFDTLIASYNNTSGSSFQVDIYNSVYIILRSYSGLSSTVNFNMHCSSYYGNYCVSNLNPDCTNEDYISNVSISNTTLNNSSSCIANYSSYSDYLQEGNKTAKLVKGSTYGLNVTSTKNSIISCWIDYNENYIFESSEWTQISISSAPNMPSSMNITIPVTAAAGQKRMRIRSRTIGNVNGPNDACTQFGSGETEDYIVSIVNSSSFLIANFSSTQSSINTDGTINFFDKSNNSPTTWNWTFVGGTPSSSTQQNPTNIKYQTAGIYPVTLTVTNANSSDTYTSFKYVSVIGTANCNIGLNPNCNSLQEIKRVKIYGTDLHYAALCTNGNASYASINPTDSGTCVLTKGVSYKLGVTTSSSSKISCWIDYNQNNIFEHSEYTAIALSSTPNIESNKFITIPREFVASGFFKMRIRSSASASLNDAGNACTSLGNGDTEDYLIVIAESNFSYTTDLVRNGTFNPYINGVLLNNLNNQNTGAAGGPNYFDYTSLSADLNAGQYLLEISSFVPNLGEKVAFFIDFNNNNNFDYPSEKIWESSQLTDPSNLSSYNITVPSTIQTTRLRIVSVYEPSYPGASVGANLGPTEGEIEDYTLNFNGGIPKPLVNFSANNLNITVGTHINFTDLSSNNPTQWQWFFEGAETSSSILQNPINIRYNTPGCYKVVLVASNSAGSNVKVQNCYINVSVPSQLPLANFTSNNTDIVMENTVNFLDQSLQNPTSWQWTFEGGIPSTSNLQNPTNILYDIPGCFKVTLVVSNAFGTDTIIRSCYVQVVNNEYCIPENTGIPPSYASFINGVTLNGFSNLNSGITLPNCYYNNSAVSTILNVNNTYSITLNRGGNCNHYAVWIDYNNDGDFIDPGEKVAFAQGVTTSTITRNFTVPSTIVSGNYRLRIRATYQVFIFLEMDPCENYIVGETEDYNIQIIGVPLPPPVANFTANTFSIEVGQSINFTDLSTNTPTSWSWTFAGASPASSNAQNPSNITYNTAGCYQVSLTATNSAGNNTYTQTCYINVTNVNPYCIPLPVNGTNFGDYINSVTIGTISNINSGAVAGPSYSNYSNLSTNLSTNTAYNIVVQNGTYTNDSIAAWIDYNDDGDFADAGEKLDQVSAPIINANYTLNFTVPGSVPLGSKRLRVRIAYLPASAPNMDPCTNYNYGETEDYSVNIVAGTVITPVANFTASSFNITTGQSVNFTDLSTNNPTSWSWTFTGGTPASSTSQNPTNITYNTPGCYQVSLTATNSAGSNTSTQTCYITVTNVVITPVANFTASSLSISPLVNQLILRTFQLTIQLHGIGLLPVEHLHQAHFSKSNEYHLQYTWLLSSIINCYQ
jgi:PKD repeat protein